MTKEKIRKGLLITAGTISVVLGTVGIFLPVLPTTPFLLLAAYCYVRSSPRLYRMLMNNRFFGSFLRNYLEGKGMTLKYKVMTLLFLWLVIGATIVIFTQSTVIRLTLMVVVIGVTIHILSLKTVSKKRVLAQNQTQSPDRPAADL